MFTKTGPANLRPEVGDAVVLITDGEPYGKKNTPELTKQYAKDLKDRNVLIVAVGIGPRSENEKFQNVLLDLATSRDYFVKAQFDKLGHILDMLVVRSCVRAGRLFYAIYRKETSKLILNTCSVRGLVFQPLAIR